jgi:hypothetical protein
VITLSARALSNARRLVSSGSLLIGSVGHAIAANQLVGPPGWLAFDSDGGGVVAAYRWPEADGSFHHSLGAVVYTNYGSLDEFIGKNLALLRAAPAIRIDHENRIKICGEEPAWEIQYADGRTKTQVKITLQVAVVKDGYTYLASYVRGSADQARGEAVAWTHSFCKRV